LIVFGLHNVHALTTDRSMQLDGQLSSVVLGMCGFITADKE